MDLNGKSAFITGGASGIGFGMAYNFLRAGMRVVIVDIEQSALTRAAEELASLGEVHALRCDVSDQPSLNQCARQAIKLLGAVHVVCNNAGVGAGGLQENLKAADWNWVLGVNLMGVVYGVQAFVPHMKAHAEGGHFVNTASMAGVVTAPGMGPYSASKFAVVGLSEGLAAELAEDHIGVSILCPGWVNTRINESARNRPGRFDNQETTSKTAKAMPLSEPTQSAQAQRIAEALRTGMDPKQVGERVLNAIRNNELYVFTHPEMRAGVDQRHFNIAAAFDRASSLNR